MRGHTGHLVQRFSKPLVATTVGAGAAGSLALGVAAGVSTAGSLVLVGLPLVLLPGLALGCHRLLNTPSDSPGPCGPTLRITDMRSGVSPKDCIVRICQDGIQFYPCLESYLINQ